MKHLNSRALAFVRQGLAGLFFLAMVIFIGTGEVGAQRGKPLVITTGSDLFRIANPAMHRFSSIMYWHSLLFNGLTRYNVKMEAVPDLAKSWTISEDGLTYTFNLRKGVKWADGAPFTADDVKFTYELLLHPDNRGGRNHLQYFIHVLGASAYRARKVDSLKGVEVLGPHRVRVRLSRRYAPFIISSASWAIVPKHILGNVPVKTMGKHPFMHKPVGTGPYVLKSWKSRARTVLVRNPNYFGRKPGIEKIIFRTQPDAFSRLAGLRTGQIGVNGIYGGLPVHDFEGVGKDPCCRAVRLAGQANWFLDLNLKNPLFRDVRVRRAISYAIDRKAMLKNLFNGWGIINNSPFHPLSWAHKKDVPLYDGDPEKAKALLEEAGWKVGPDGIRVKDGKRFSFTWRVVSGGRASSIMAEAATPMLRAVGIEVKVIRHAFVTLWFKHWRKKKFDALSHLFPNSVWGMADPDESLPQLYDHRINTTSYHNPKVEALIQKGASTSDRAKRKKIYYEIQEIIAKDAVRLWLLQTDELWGVDRKLVMPELETGFLRIRVFDQWSWKK